MAGQMLARSLQKISIDSSTQKSEETQQMMRTLASRFALLYGDLSLLFGRKWFPSPTLISSSVRPSFPSHYSTRQFHSSTYPLSDASGTDKGKEQDAEITEEFADDDERELFQKVLQDLPEKERTFILEV
jgi:hypothetical protein